ncbi:MAG: membrane protein insertase YidC [Epsilonproteobacteria bacterium]|nr:membrane protein insertase YidC [Campylobacterota bacterium]
MNDNLRRIVLATVISFVFFVAYDYFVLQPQMKAAQKTDKTEKTAKSTQKITSQKKISTTTIATIKSKDYEIKIDSLGRIGSFVLQESKFNVKGKKLELISGKNPKPLEIRFKDENLNKELVKTVASVNKSEIFVDKPKTLTITQKLPSLTVRKIVTFYPNGRYDVEVKLSKPALYFISPGYRPSAVIDQLTIHGVIVKKADDTLEIVEDGSAELKEIDSAIIAAGFDRYYTTLFFSKKPLKAYITPDENNNPVVFFENSDKDLKLIGYIGPKYVDTLKSIDVSLVDVVQYGVGTFFARNLFLLLDALYKVSQSWGIAIILLVILVRIVLFPLTFKGMVSMYKLKELAPKMKEIQEKYKKDPQKLQLHMMQLYKKHNVNPLGGCLPLVLQIPIFYGIYKLLLYSIELKGASFLWISDLSEMDPYFILPVLMGVSMYIHQRLTPANFQDPMQEKIFKFLPVIFTVMMATFPAGLVLYWTVNNILSVLQQLLINKLMATKAKK